MSHPTTKGMADNKPANEPANGPAIECSVCGDEGTKSTTAIVCGDSVCHSCITEMFTLATEDESNYPPQWASHKLDIADFLDAIPVPVQHQFRTKSKEWEVKPVDRMYCQVKTASELPGEVQPRRAAPSPASV
ncbi:hypothetical protein B0A55_02428 [Friedmanniomyces simplex]|uniref:Uncharacterized protein n=1 Tax=Friedmanniomyces simplex TaxID=329884 RepID=A0A4U0XUF7_9PEZI|nr:hypothetical protein B0A55_02428 [Friedmanniomyces simplex]